MNSVKLIFAILELSVALDCWLAFICTNKDRNTLGLLLAFIQLPIWPILIKLDN